MMTCIDCPDEKDPDLVGVCQDCGAAVCAHDAVVRPRTIERQGILFDREQVPAGRVLRCGVCDAARSDGARSAGSCGHQGR